MVFQFLQILMFHTVVDLSLVNDWLKFNLGRCDPLNIPNSFRHFNYVIADTEEALKKALTEDLIFVDEKVQEANQTNPQIQINAKGISADFMERYREEQEKKRKVEEAKRKLKEDSSIFQAKLKAEKEKAANKQRQLEKEEYCKSNQETRRIV